MFRNNNDFCRPEKFYVLIETDVYRDVRSPEGQVVTEELHDQSAVLVGLLAQGVQLWDGLIKSLLIAKEGNISMMSCADCLNKETSSDKEEKSSRDSIKSFRDIS
jgi:hypothetical protein